MGNLLTTVAEINQEFDASKAAITQALGRLRRRKEPLQPLARQRSVAVKRSNPTIRQIAFIRPAYPSTDYDRLLYAIQEAAAKRNWGVETFSYSSPSSLNISRALEANDAALFVPWPDSNPGYLKKAIESAKKPVISLREAPPSNLRIRSILLDDYEIGRLASSHLVQLGHRNIVAMTSESHSTSASHRLSAWRDVLERNGVRHTASFLADCSVKPGGNSILESYQKFKEWLQDPARPDFTAIFCLDWTGALAATRALRESGILIPRDVSIVTYSGEEDWSAFLFLNPAITTVEIDLADFAEKSLEQVEKSFQGTLGLDTPIKLKPFLIERESTAEPFRGYNCLSSFASKHG